MNTIITVTTIMSMYMNLTTDVENNKHCYNAEIENGRINAIEVYDKKGEYPFKKIKDIVKEILEIAIKDQKGIELNTSYVRYGLNDLTPSKDILKLYYDLGGKIITIGSDSHQKDHLGKYIEENKQILKEIGFKEFCTFDKMKPIFWEL